MDSATRSSAAFDRAFTLVEVMISLTLASFLLAGVFGAITYLSKAQVLTSAYVDMSAQSRAALEWMADDTRQMRGVTVLADGFSGTITTAAGDILVRYQYDAALGQVLRRLPSRTEVLWDQVRSCEFSYYGAGTMDTSANPPRMARGAKLAVGTSTKVKQIQVSLQTVATVLRTHATQQTISAQFTVRP